MSVIFNRLYSVALDHEPEFDRRAGGSSPDSPSRTKCEDLYRYHQARLRPPQSASLTSRIKGLFRDTP